ncbi:sigma-70 family RNA polymerase sigma factor [Streptomyces sp. NRRL WC-3742]|uniref:sigma-70 family RNA polymerase sigma factor n=1 Tax=Streptomyces sp. NRRL WC-3742 TaxID=1463934 RepID=UPI0004CBB4F8|nr:sigma-70 family RNA polymerase sigma factor [Streptomyces sp. NRRL WC-3742]
MVTDVDTTLVTAARDGDRAALDEVVAAYLPLVYNIVGRALARDAEVDDTVQDVMLHVVRGLPGLRDPEAFRSWLVAITMNQVRSHHRPRQADPHPQDVFDTLPDPQADFAELSVWKLRLTGQRQETARAAAWLDDDHRDLLSLWWLVESGQLSRADLIAATGANAHAVTVRIGRMKKQLDTARGIVRALAATPRCPDLTALTADWPGVPGPLWRKRIARHTQDCRRCRDAGSDLVPVEGLLAGLALVPLPVGLVGKVTSNLPGVPAGPAQAHGRASHRKPKSRQDHWKTKVAAAVVAVTAIGGTAAVLEPETGNPTPRSAPLPSASAPDSPAATPRPTGAASAPVTADPIPRHASPSPTGPAPVPSSVTSPSASRGTPSPAASATPSAAPSTATPSAATSTTGSAGAAEPEEQVLVAINRARAEQNLPALQRTTALNRSANGHSQAMLSGCGLNHTCPGEPNLGARGPATAENIGNGGPVANTPGAIGGMAVGLTNAMLAETAPEDGHRRNILGCSYRHVGISIVRDGSGRIWMTQDFSG